MRILAYLYPMQKKQILITQALTDAGAELARQFQEEGWYVFGLDTHDNYVYHCDRFLIFDFERFATDAAYRVKMSAVLDELIKRLDALVFQFEPFRPLRSTPLEFDEWQSALAVYLTTPFLLAKLFAERLKKEQGAIFSIIDRSPAKKATPALASRPLRETLQSLTLAFAEDWAPHIRANVLTYERPDENLVKPSFGELSRLVLFLASGQTQISGKIL